MPNASIYIISSAKLILAHFAGVGKRTKKGILANQKPNSVVAKSFQRASWKAQRSASMENPLSDIHKIHSLKFEEEDEVHPMISLYETL